MSLMPSKLNESGVETSEAVLDAPAIESPTIPRPERDPDETAKGSLYRVIWRWHFFAGLIVAPILLIATVTGAIYIFHNELSNWLYEDLYFVEPAAARLSYDEQHQIALNALDGAEIEFLSVWNDPRRSVQFTAHIHAGEDDATELHRVAFINPYTGDVLGTRIMEREFFNIVLTIHRNLFAGTTGRIFVELATSWGIVLLITGVYLWWPRNKNRIRGVWLPRLRAKPYIVLRDLHAVSGVYLSGFAAIILATGLFISVVWGTGYALVSVQAGQSLGDFFAPAESRPSAPDDAPAPLETVITNIQRHYRPGDVLYHQFPTSDDVGHKAYLMREGDTNTVRGFDIDQYTGELIAVTNTDELTPMVRVLALAISLHQGLTFGMPTKILAMATCLALVAMTITGIWMWWKRRPRGETGFPRKPPGGVVPRWIWGIVIVVGIALPTVGASILVIVAGSWLMRCLIPARPLAAANGDRES